MVLVTGGAGFIGSHLAERLIESNPAKILVLDNLFLGSVSNISHLDSFQEGIQFIHADASDESSVRKIVVDYRVDVVFNLAIVPLPTSLEFPRWTIAENIAMTMALCELSRDHSIEKLVHFSSSEVYGSGEFLPMSESHPLKPTTPYASSKAATDLIVESYIKTFDISALIIRPFNNFGPRQNDRSYAGIVPTVAKHLIRGTTIEIYGNGEQTRDFVFVRDTVDLAVELSSVEEAMGSSVNIATGIETSVNEIVDMMCRIFGKEEHPREHLKPRKSDIARHCGDPEKLQKFLGRGAGPISEQNLTETLEYFSR